jgi:hypothetical protein
MIRRRRRKGPTTPPPSRQIFERYAFKILQKLDTPPPEGDTWTERNLQTAIRPPAAIWKPLLDKLEEGGLIVRKQAGLRGTRRIIYRNEQLTLSFSIADLGLAFEEEQAPYQPDDQRERQAVEHIALQVRLAALEDDRGNLEQRIKEAENQAAEARAELAAARYQLFALKMQLADEQSKNNQ